MLKKFGVIIFAGLFLTNSIIGLGSNPVNASSNDLFSLMGFAAMNGGTTGGTGGTELTINNLSDFTNFLNQRKKNKDTTPKILKVIGKISGYGAIGVKEVQNLTIIGVGNKGELEGVGLNIVKSSNIIIQNLKIHNTMAPTDCIGIENSKNVWIDHCELYNMIGDCNGDGKVDTKGDIEGGDVDWYDGLLDCKGDSAYITVSWNYMHDSFKACLVGSSDSDNFDRRMTFHHNLFKNIRERAPSYRFGTGHIFNNCYIDVSSSTVNSRMEAKLRIENNYFEKVGSGAVNKDSGLAAGPIGSYNSNKKGLWDVKDNMFVNCKGNQPSTSTCSYTPAYKYSNILTPVNDVKALVIKNSGVGKLDGYFNGNTDTNTNIDLKIIFGDISEDGSVDTIDFAAYKRYLLGEIVSINLEAADLNGDKTVNTLDFAILKKYLLGLITSLPLDNSKINDYDKVANK